MTDKRVYFIAGLPRSGSTLLTNILAQHPAINVTPTSGIVDMLVQVRNSWDQNDAFRAMERNSSESTKQRVLRAMLQAYFADMDEPVCIDKNRYWCEFLEMAEVLVGGRENVKVLVTVRDMRDVVASFERLHRQTSAMGQLPQEQSMAMKFKTALGRLEVFVDDTQPVGRAYNAIRDAVTRGWKDCMHFIDYDDLTDDPERVLSEIYAFLGEAPCQHDFDNVQQVTTEDDFVYGFKDLHTIRPKVEPQQPQWQKMYDDAVFQSPLWQNIQSIARFWTAYQQPDKISELPNSIAYSVSMGGINGAS